MRRLARLGLVLALAGLAGGCSTSSVVAPNLPPETTLFVQFDPSDGAPHTVPYEVKLSWFGLDEDGTVVAYEIRFRDPARPADTLWVRTTATDSTIAVPTPTGAATPRFEVRAIDDAGAVDGSPASQEFSFTNRQPVIRITNKLIATDSTYGSVSITWLGVDPDGDAGRLVTRVWLDGNEAAPRLVTGTSFTVPTIDFKQGQNWYSGPRKLYVQAIDPGGFASVPDSMTWYVRRPCPDTTRARGRVLLIDDVPSSLGAGNTVVDTLWWNGVLRNFPPDAISILRLDRTQPFRTAEDLRQTFEQFDNVIWYRGQVSLTGVSTLMRSYESGMAAYLDNGGTVLLEGFSILDGLESDGSLSASFQSTYLAVDSLRTHSVELGAVDVELWSLTNVSSTLRSSLYPAFLQQTGTLSQVRALGVRDTADVALWARAGALGPPNPEDYPVGVRALLPSGGQGIAFTTALRNLDGAGGNRAPAFLKAVLQSLPGTRPQPLPTARLRKRR